MSMSLIKNRVSYRADREVVKSSALIKIMGITIFIILTTLGAYVYIPLPFTPVPITLQTFFVILSGAVLGPREGFFSQLGYLTLGTVGLPLFSGARGGRWHLFGPTGGYLWGFLFSAWLVGKLIQKKRINRLFFFGCFSLGILTIYFFGLFQLSLFVKKGLFILLQKGVLPFIFPDFLKVMLATWVYSYLKSK